MRNFHCVCAGKACAYVIMCYELIPSAPDRREALFWSFNFLDRRNRNYFSFLKRIVSGSAITRQDYIWVCSGVFYH